MWIFWRSKTLFFYLRTNNTEFGIIKYWLSFIHSVSCLTTGPKPPLKRFLHIVQSRASSFKWEYPLLSLRSSSSFLHLLPCLIVTSISPFIFPSITCFRRQFLRKMWPIQLAYRFLISYRIFLCSLTVTLLHLSHDRSNWSFPPFQIPLHTPKLMLSFLLFG